MSVRRCTEADLPWIITLAKKHYGDLIADTRSTYEGVKLRLKDSKAVVLRTDKAVLIGFISKHFFAPEKVFGVIEIFYGNALQLRSLFKAIKKWFEERGVGKASIGILTDHDFSGFMKLIGAKQKKPQYLWEF